MAQHLFLDRISFSQWSKSTHVSYIRFPHMRGYVLGSPFCFTGQLCLPQTDTTLELTNFCIVKILVSDRTSCPPCSFIIRSGFAIPRCLYFHINFRISLSSHTYPTWNFYWSSWNFIGILWNPLINLWQICNFMSSSLSLNMINLYTDLSSLIFPNKTS